MGLHSRPQPEGVREPRGLTELGRGPGTGGTAGGWSGRVPRGEGRTQGHGWVTSRSVGDDDDGVEWRPGW